MAIYLNRRDMIGGALGASLTACTATKPKFDAQVIVIGAGLSGLYAAMLLEDEGKDVLVIEADNRIGGRMKTLRHQDGVTEGGGQQIGASYARILDVAAKLNVPLYSETGRGPATAYYLDDQWQAAQELDVKLFPKAYRSTPPSSVLFRLLAKEPALETSDAWRDAPENMDISAAEFLSQRGFDAKAQNLIERALNANQLSTYSMLNLHRSLQLYRQSANMGATQYVEGGSQRLPEAMAASLKRPVKIGTKVSSIDLSGDRVAVTIAGARKTYHAEHVICTIPFAALSHPKGPKINAALNGVQKEAIQSLPYTQILQIHGRANTAYWEQDGLAPSMWFDSPLERIFAQSDRNGKVTGFVTNWLNGVGTEGWLDGGEASAFKQLTDELSKVRPSLAENLNLLTTVNWTSSNPLAGGAYMHWAPGQARRWAADMGQPAGRLYFAGEHLSHLHTGMEGAMESAEAAAFHLLNI